jgi:SAM-dependent methyltransferase
MQTDQELFAKGLATYQKVVNLNYLAHKEVYDVLRRAQMTEAPDQFVFLDIACGAASASAEALKGTRVGRYIGIDISQPSLDVARKLRPPQRRASALCPLSCNDANYAFQSGCDFSRDFRERWVADTLHRGARVDRGNFGAAGRRLLDDHVAGQHHADLVFGGQRLMGERRIAGSEDAILTEFDTEFLLHRRGHVDIGQHAEALALERRDDFGNGLVKAGLHGAGDIVFHGLSS